MWTLLERGASRYTVIQMIDSEWSWGCMFFFFFYFWISSKNEFLFPVFRNTWKTVISLYLPDCHNGERLPSAWLSPLNTDILRFLLLIIWLTWEAISNNLNVCNVFWCLCVSTCMQTDGHSEQIGVILFDILFHSLSKSHSREQEQPHWFAKYGSPLSGPVWVTW